MRTTFDNAGAGGWAQPANPPRVRRLASWAAIFVLSVMALGLGAAVAAAYEALCDIGCARRDGPDMVTVDDVALGFAILFAVTVLGVGFGIWRMVQSDEYDRGMMDGE